jgi:hypothetical protein
MSKAAKTLERVLSGRSDSSIRFADLCHLLRHFGFALRIRGDHHIFTRDGVEAIINLQPLGTLAKAYQVRQVRNLLARSDLEEFGDV